MPSQAVAVKLTSSTGASIVYVYGTVNGQGVEWRRYQGDIWRTEAPRSGDGAYAIEITGWDELGRSTVYSTTLQYGFAAITNRGPGAYYNASDLNRVGRAVEYLADLLRGYGYKVEVSPRADWTMADIPTPEEMDTYLGNIRVLMDTYCVMPSTPPLPDSMNRLGYRGANSIEQALVDMHILITNMAAAWYCCGEIYTGEV